MTYLILRILKTGWSYHEDRNSLWGSSVIMDCGCFAYHLDGVLIMAISIRFILPDRYFRDGDVYNTLDKFKLAFESKIKTEYHLYQKGDGLLLRVLDTHGYFWYEAKIYILGNKTEKEECIEYITNKAILQKIF